VAAIVGAIIYANMGQSSSATPARTNSTNPAAAKATPPPNASKGAEPAWARGANNALVTLEECADFECPSCAVFQPTLQEVKTIYGDRVRIIFRQYPLQMHPKAYDASRAAEAAGMQGKFWEMSDKLFQKQKDWKMLPDHRAEYANYAKELGLDVEKFKSDMIGQVASQRVAADKKRGDELGIRSTPSVFLNGRLLAPDEMSAARMRQAIDAAIQGR
ncbi:MAG TPA: thioredoxin domain-containing protein, partial [Pyrinomonadaceae bacterium]|nr:thioredoxin domain-containing protein [Pyrinomonadaceae bacterium]